MKRDNRQILVNPHSSVEKIPAGALNLGEIGVQHNNVEDAALYVETVADSESASTVAKFITEKAIDGKIENAMDLIQLEIDGINNAVGLPHEDPEGHWSSAATVWDAIEQTYEEMTAGTAAASTRLVLDEEPETEKYMGLSAKTDQATSSITYTLGLKGIDEAIDEAVEIASSAITEEIKELEEKVAEELGELVDVVEEFSAATEEKLDELDDKVDELSAGTESEIARIDEAIEELEEKVEVNEVSSEDGSIIVTTSTGGTDLSVNIDNTSIVLNDNNELVADLKLSSITPSDVNVREEFALMNSAGDQLGESIKIYKDSSLYRALLGHVDDTLSDPTDPESLVSGSGDTALDLIYHKEDGTYELVTIDVNDFLEESEFKDGLVVDNHVVKVKVDEASEKVKISSAETVDVLSVSADGVKLSNIQAAIDFAVEELAGNIDADVTGSSEDGRVTVEVVQKDTALESVAVSIEDIASAEAVGLAADGSFIPKSGTAFIDSASSVEEEILALDEALSDTIADFAEVLEQEKKEREEADAELLGNSASTSADTSIMGLKALISEITMSVVKDINTPSGETLLEVSKEDTPEGDIYTISSSERLNSAVTLAETSVQDVEFASIEEPAADFGPTQSGVNAVVEDNILKLDMSYLKVDCGEY